MNISPEEAQASLEAISRARASTRGAKGFNGYFLIIWGLVWFFGFLANQYLSGALMGWSWGILTTIGWVSSTFLGIHQGKQAHSVIGARIAWFFGVLAAFTGLWMLILQPLTMKQGSLFIITVLMFGGAVAGVLTHNISSIIGCVSITLLAVAGYYLVPTYFFLWTAFTCGLTMVVIGLVLRLHWR